MLDFLLHGFIKVTEPFYYKGGSMPKPLPTKEQIAEDKKANEIKPTGDSNNVCKNI